MSVFKPYISSKQHILQAVELSQRSQTAVQIVSNLLAPSNGGPFHCFLGASRPCRPDGWLALLLTKAGEVETIPGPRTSHKRVWICDICYKQIHVRKKISIRCNIVEPQMRRYPPNTIHRYLDLPSAPRIQTHTSHLTQT